MITSYGPEESKTFSELSLIYGPTAAKLIMEENKNEKKRTGKKAGRNKKKSREI